MTEHKCSRCGECCKVIPISKRMMPIGTLAYFRARGIQETQDFFLIPNVCKQLVSEGDNITRCAIYDTRPNECKAFTGKGFHRVDRLLLRYYVPDSCTCK